MEYLLDRGAYTDVPFDEIMSDFAERYPYLFEDADNGMSGDFAAEAAADRQKS